MSFMKRYEASLALDETENKICKKILKERQNVQKRHLAEKKRRDNKIMHIYASMMELKSGKSTSENNKDSYESKMELETINISSDEDYKGESLEINAQDSKKHLIKTVDLILQFVQTNPDEQTVVKEAWYTDSNPFKFDDEKSDVEKCTIEDEKIFDNWKLRKEIENEKETKEPHFIKSDFTDFILPNLDSCQLRGSLISKDQENEKTVKHFSDDKESKLQCVEETLGHNFRKDPKGDDDTKSIREQIKLQQNQDQDFPAEVASESFKSISLPFSEKHDYLKKQRGSLQECDVEELQAVLDGIPNLDSLNADKSICLSNISLSYLHSIWKETNLDAMPETMPTVKRNMLSCDSVLHGEFSLEANFYQLQVYCPSSEMNENAEVLSNIFGNTNNEEVHEKLKCTNLIKKMPLSMDNRVFSASKENKGLCMDKVRRERRRINFNIKKQKKSKNKGNKKLKKCRLKKKSGRNHKASRHVNPPKVQHLAHSDGWHRRNLAIESSIERSHQNVCSGDRLILSGQAYIDLSFCKWNCRRSMNGSSKSSGYQSNSQNNHRQRSGRNGQNNQFQGGYGNHDRSQGGSGDGDDGDKEKKPKYHMVPNIKEDEEENSDEENTEDDRDVYHTRPPNNKKGDDGGLRNPSDVDAGQAELNRTPFDQEHSSLTVDDLCDLLGRICDRPTGNVFEGKEHALNICFTRIMHQLHLASLDVDGVTDCQTCQVLESFFRHLAYSEDNCEAKCNLCHQIHTLILHHCELCLTQIQPRGYRTATDLCFKICQAVTDDVRMLRNDPQIMRMVVEYCSNILKILPEDEDIPKLNEPVREPVKSSQTSVCQDATTATNANVVTGSTVATEEFKFVSGHKFCSQNHPLDIIDETTEFSDREHSDMEDIPRDEQNSQKNYRQSSSVELSNTSQAFKYTESVTRKTPSGNAVSLPEGTINEGIQFQSVADQPTGTRGIGEVVFADYDRLCLVAKYWQRKKEECEETNQKPSQLREEGVILERYKSKFSILLTRYQQDNQWKQLASLGYGMHGRCFLAMDMKTEHKFCVKRIDLLHYEADELCLWADLDNPYIVHFYGAIRHGYHVYIFAEFIDGGDLAYVIREEKAKGQRLSHWTAINYFQQLLKALHYLQSRNILHEDIKAENILLYGNSPHIAVTDFGISRRLQGQTEMKNKWPVGTATHFSPEKAASMGHGFPADVWAAICVLVYMLSGKLPWHKYLKRADCLNFIIFMRPPPMDDLPINIQDGVRDLITKGFVKEPEKRPSAKELLEHPAFQILNGETPESFYSTLMTGLNSLSGAGHNLLAVPDVGKAHDKRTSVAQKNDDSEPTKSTCTDTVLYSLSIPQGASGPHLTDDVEVENAEISSTMPQLNALLESSSMKENSSDLPLYPGPENDSSVRNLDGIPQKQETHNLCTAADQDIRFPSSKISITLLPKLDELLPSSPNPVKDFFKDSYDSTQVFYETRYSSQLQVFQPPPVQTPDLIPHLSIFYGSMDMGDGNTALPNFSLLNSGSLHNQEMYLEGLIIDNPSSIDESIVSDENLPSGSPEKNQGDHNFGLSFASNSKLGPREENTIVRPSAGMVNPSKSPTVRSSAEVRKSSDAASVLRKKPQNLRLDVSMATHQQDSPSFTQSRIKREITHTRASTKIGSLASQNGQAVVNEFDIFTEQYLEYKEIMSSQSSDAGKFSSMFDPDSDSEEPVAPQSPTHDMETARLTDETPPEGKKISFYLESNGILFSMRFLSTPISLHQNMSEIRNKIYGQGYKHFELQHMDGSTLSRSSELLCENINIKIVNPEEPCGCVGCCF